jgi:hypothetical protein
MVEIEAQARAAPPLGASVKGVAPERVAHRRRGSLSESVDEIIGQTERVPPTYRVDVRDHINDSFSARGIVGHDEAVSTRPRLVRAV